MSGGFFNDNGTHYFYYELFAMARNLEDELQKDDPEMPVDVKEYLTEYVCRIKQMGEIIRHIDYYYAGDHDADSFKQAINCVEDMEVFEVDES